MKESLLTSRPLEFSLGTYTVKAGLEGKSIFLRAYSDISKKLF